MLNLNLLSLNHLLTNMLALVISQSVIPAKPAIVSARDLKIEDLNIYSPTTKGKTPLHISVALLLSCGLFFCSGAWADRLEMPTDIGANSNEAMLGKPQRGMSMEQVTQQFGPPSSKVSPVGDPPISRWIYPQFTVHFESELVIHAVVKK